MTQDTHPFPLKRIGIIGGGQLGKMMAMEAKKMGFYIAILDPTPGCPASQFADIQLMGGFYDKAQIRLLVEQSDVTTYDIEHIDTEILLELEAEGHTIHPSPKVLATIQDKLIQKEVLSAGGVPVPRFKRLDHVNKEQFEEFGFPCVQKTRKGGYDGRGVYVVKNAEGAEKAMQAVSMIEEFVDFEMEIAVLAARSTEGEIRCHPVVEMLFDARANICDMVIAPARIPAVVEEEARRVAMKAIEILGGVGIFGVELFVTRGGKILLNEIAPRPHNSGHFTIEACDTSQFEQHIRAIAGLPLGSGRLLSPAVMLNLLGEPGFKGNQLIEGLEAIHRINGLTLHLYGKLTTMPFRKMGHLTVLDADAEKALQKCYQAKEIFKIKGEESL